MCVALNKNRWFLFEKVKNCQYFATNIFSREKKWFFWRFGPKNWKGWPDNFETFHKDIDSSSSFYQESPPWTHCVLAASSYRPCFPLTPWYWNILSSGVETFSPVVLKHWNTPWYKKNQACGWFSNSYCPFQHSTFPTLICLQQSSLSRFKKDNFYIADFYWLFESKHDLE